MMRLKKHYGINLYMNQNFLDMTTRYEKYKSEQLQNPEFRVAYTLAQKKVKLQIQLEKLREDIKQGKKSAVLLRRLNQLSNAIKEVKI